MSRLFPMILLGLVSLAEAAPPAAPSPTGEAEAALKAKGLKRSGTTYVLGSEAEFQAKLNKARTIYKAINAAAARKQEFERGVQMGRAQIRQFEQERVMLNQALTQDLPVDEHNRIVARVNAINGQMRLMMQDQSSPDQQQVPGAKLAIQRQEFIEAVLELRMVADRVAEEYAGIEKDDEVAKALASLNGKTKSKLTIGPSKTFLTNLKTLEGVEGTVLTEDVTLRKEGGVFWVDVTFNGKTMKPMIFDTGASTIVLPAETADELGLKPGPDAETVKARVADGSDVEAKRIVIPSMRVGKFTVKDVEGIVMPASKTNVPPLLGQSFHKLFTYKFSAESGRLVLSKVETAESAEPPPTKAKGKSATKTTRKK